WTDNSLDETGFKIYRSTDGVTFNWTGTVSANVTTYSEGSRSPATTYWYQVRSYNANGDSAFSNTASATTMALPNAPSNLTATPISGSQINLAWTDNSADETGFKIYRSTDGVTFNWTSTVGANVTAFTETGRTPATTYWYQVRAYNTNGDSLQSNTAIA